MKPQAAMSGAPVARGRAGQHIRYIVYAFFFLSGAISLIYQVAWVRMLSLFFGSDAYSAAMTLSVFMGGLALGSWLASRFADRIARPLLIYGVLEILAALSALVAPFVLDAFFAVYKVVYVSSFDTQPWLYQSFRVVVAMATLLVPTTMMGATLPLLVRRFAHEISELGRQAGELYAANTAGALVGTIGAGFVLLPYLGVWRTVECAVTVGLAIGIASVGLGRGRIATSRPVAAARASHAEREDAGPPRTWTRRSVLLVMALSGLAALALEVVWMRVLVQSFSGTVYAFSIMLACFLIGIYFGSNRAATIVDRQADPIRFMALLQLGLGLSVAVLAVLVHVVPPLFGMLVWTLTGVSGGAFGVASVIAQFIVASLLIIGPTTMLGAMFPFAVRAFASGIDRRASATGAVYAANTTGAILGALLGGFVLLPLIGTQGGLLVIALVFALNGLLLGRVGAPDNRFVRHPASVVMIVLGLAAGGIGVALPRQTILNYNMQRSSQPMVVYHGDGVSNTVEIVKNDAANVIMMINGNIEADTSYIQRRHFILKADLPLLLHPHPRDVAIVGLGLGVTLAATARYPTVENIRVIELSPEMVAAHSHLTTLTGNILANPRVNLRIDDGRNFMAMSDESFDMITADPIHPRITGVGYLYTREYYESIKSRLRPGGVVTQWMPMYHISPESFDVAFRTFAEVFPNATFWYVRGHGLFVATKEEMRIDCRTLIANFDDPKVKADLASIDIRTPAELLGFMLMDSEHIARYLARNGERTVNTDDNAHLEYRTPFEFLGRTDDIIPDMLKYAGWDPARIFGPGCSDDLKQAALQYHDKRVSRILDELKEPIR
jgi:spermidine synthase